MSRVFGWLRRGRIVSPLRGSEKHLVGINFAPIPRAPAFAECLRPLRRGRPAWARTFRPSGAGSERGGDSDWGGDGCEIRAIVKLLCRTGTFGSAVLVCNLDS
jgi:hypothetical protein